jgi:hypothetical protein
VSVSRSLVACGADCGRATSRRESVLKSPLIRRSADNVTRISFGLILFTVISTVIHVRYHALGVVPHVSAG